MNIQQPLRARRRAWLPPNMVKRVLRAGRGAGAAGIVTGLLLTGLAVP